MSVSCKTGSNQSSKRREDYLQITHIDLLSRALRRSTISARGLNGRVRDGIGWGTPAITT
ncbi:unnamed protein product, partial [Ectocarpus sp. 12 AP-2014]